jgi:hypothetical protein
MLDLDAIRRRNESSEIQSLCAARPHVHLPWDLMLEGHSIRFLNDNKETQWSIRRSS